MKKQIKVNKLYLEKLGMNISDAEYDEIKDKEIKRINYDSELDVQPLEGDDGYSYGTVSSVAVDSDGDVVIPRGVDITRYERNPVVLSNHSINNPIAYTERLNINNDKIIAKIKFSSIPEAQRIRQLIKDKVLRTHSIGFIPKKGFVRGERGFDDALLNLKSEFPEKFNGGKEKLVDRIITESLLVEISIVTIPSNVEAEIQIIKSLNEETEEQVEKVIEKNEEVINEVVEEVIEEVVEEIVEEKQYPKIKVISRANPIKLISTAAERELEAKKQLYLKLWGV